MYHFVIFNINGQSPLTRTEPKSYLALAHKIYNSLVPANECRTSITTAWYRRCSVRSAAKTMYMYVQNFQYNCCCMMGMENSERRRFPPNNLGRIWYLPWDQGIAYDLIIGWYTCFNFCPELCSWMKLSLPTSSLATHPVAVYMHYNQCQRATAHLQLLLLLLLSSSSFQVATTCFSCSLPDLNLLVPNFMFCIHVK